MNPVIVIGNGVHLSETEEQCREFCLKADCPIVSTWLGSDIVWDLPLHIGHFGIFGDRAANLTVQNADYIWALGASLCIPQTGYRLEHFARSARIEIPVVLEDFFKRELSAGDTQWNSTCLQWKERYGIEKEKRETKEGYVNSFDFIRRLSSELPANAVVVTDMGTSFTCTFQAARMKYGQRWLTASGFAPMGYAIPGAIGAYYATGRPVWALVGDGALQFNLASLQQIKGLPIHVIVFDNGGYLTMKHTFENHFGHRVGSEFDFPDVMELAKAFGIAKQIEVVKMDPMQHLTPRIAGMKLPDGTITSRPLEDMTPLLEREELEAQMLIPMVSE